MSLVLYLSNPGWRPDRSLSLIPLTQLDKPHSLIREDLRGKTWRDFHCCKGQKEILSPITAPVNCAKSLSHFDVKAHCLSLNLGRWGVTGSPLPCSWNHTIVLVGTWLLPASQPACSRKRHISPHCPCWMPSAFSLTPAISPSHCLSSRVNTIGQNFRTSPSYGFFVQAILMPKPICLYIAPEQCWVTRLNCLQFCEMFLYVLTLALNKFPKENA